MSTSDKVRAATMYISTLRGGVVTAPSTPRQPASRCTSVEPERPEAKNVGGAKETRAASRVTSPQQAHRVTRPEMAPLSARYQRPVVMNTVNTSRVPAPGRVQVSRVAGVPTPRTTQRGVAVPTAHMAYPTAWAYGGRIS
eukprot:CAMPEP_0114682090 /NCGR_PEP_ID=MMETSP0191-20121206/56112_1 /TAXON_ID=126664 /ORGANISM="Sorites sp." /LENGTH=139 /DNA_ID=CAMNT_0001961189 /DNA_START=161 /DNA_END=580 /DNA_ORIENTATION=-